MPLAAHLDHFWSPDQELIFFLEDEPSVFPIALELVLSCLNLCCKSQNHEICIWLGPNLKILKS